MPLPLRSSLHLSHGTPPPAAASGRFHSPSTMPAAPNLQPPPEDPRAKGALVRRLKSLTVLLLQPPPLLLTVQVPQPERNASRQEGNSSRGRADDGRQALRGVVCCGGEWGQGGGGAQRMGGRMGQCDGCMVLCYMRTAGWQMLRCDIRCQGTWELGRKHSRPKTNACIPACVHHSGGLIHLQPEEPWRAAGKEDRRWVDRCSRVEATGKRLSVEPVACGPTESHGRIYHSWPPEGCGMFEDARPAR